MHVANALRVLNSINWAHPDLHFAFPVVKSKVSDEYLPQWRNFLSQNTYFNLNDWLNFIDAQNAQGIIYAKESNEILRKLSLKITRQNTAL